jgi:RNA polymerase sigma factor (sigma-70 family)
MSRTAGQLAPVVRLLHKMAADPAAAESDGRLLERFTQGRDESAFESLMRRHGPMVLGVCRRVLDDADAADDAFQATFLVLARKSGTIRKRPSVGSWLFGVAFRIALKARANAVRRRIHERASMHPATTNPHDELVWRELRPVLDAEIDRLPEKYRSPLVLCYLEGKTNEEAARQLGWTKGTVSGRLSRARDLLRKRLVRRGLDLSAGALVTLLARDIASASVPAPLFETTLLSAAGHTAAAATVASLTEGVIHMTLWSKWQLFALVLVIASGFGLAGASWSYRAGAQGAGQAGAGPSRQAATQPDRGAELIGTWQVVGVQLKGENVPDKNELKESRWVFAKDKVTMTMAGESRDASYKLDPAKKIATMDLTILNGQENERDKTYHAIYRLQGDELKICIGDPEAERPKDFSAEGKNIVFTLKRQSKAQTDKSAPDPGEQKRAERISQEEMLRAKAMQAEAEARVRAHQARVQQAQDELDRAVAQLKVAEAALRRLQEAAEPDATARRKSQDNLKQIGLGVHNYHDTYTFLPGHAIFDKNTGKALLSWRVAILPFIDEDNLYRQFKLDEPWDSEHNIKLLDKMPEVYKSPLAKDNLTTTYYQVFTGKETPFFGQTGIRLTQIVDGTSNTILVAEAAQAVPWTKPADMTFDGKKELPKLGGVFKNGFNVLFADGSVRFFPRNIDPQTLRAMITHAGGEIIDWEKLDRLTTRK